MPNQMSRMSRHFVGLIFWLAVSGGFSFVGFQVILSNYLACKGAFELLGFEMRPIVTDELVGEIFGAFFPNATLAHLYALAVALTLAGSFFLVFHLAFQLQDLYEDRNLYLEGDDGQSARAAARLMLRDGATILVLAALLVLAAVWDIDLFRYRSIAGALGIEDPKGAATTITAWPIQLSENGHLFAWQVARWGAWGYLAVTALACLGLEFAFRKTSDTWTMLFGALGELFQPADSAREQAMLHGYDDNGQPVYEAALPLSYDAQGNPIEDDQAAAETTPTNEEVAMDPQPPQENMPGANGSERKHPATGFDALFAPPNDDSAPEAPSHVEAGQTPSRPAARMPEEDLREVVGSPDERVTLSTACANPDRYHMDLATGVIFSREHWEQLHGPGVEGDRAEAA